MRTVALAGNPNVGKSTLFNALTGLRQHTGNWPGKTVALAEGYCRRRGERWRMVDLPGTYSLAARSPEEEVAREFLTARSPDGVIVVCDATCLARSLVLALQIMELIPRTVVCVNLMDEAAKKGIGIDIDALARDLGVPVAAVSARDGAGLEDLLSAVEEVMETPPAPAGVRYTAPIRAAAAVLTQAGLPLSAALAALTGTASPAEPELLAAAREAAKEAGLPPERLPEAVVSCAVLHADAVAAGAVTWDAQAAHRRDRRIDRLLTGKWTAWPLMLLLLCGVLWITLKGVNVFSGWLTALFAAGQRGPAELFAVLQAPHWLTGAAVEGAYGVLAWVVAVMLPPMAIFFPLFTLLEDVGYLPRIAFNLDRGFQRAKACGKQALTMCMGLGCNAVGVTGCRILDSPRERLIATLTNSLMPCNGRFPLLITLITLFFAGNSFASAGLLAAGMVLAVAVTLLLSRLLSATLLKGVPSSFTLELPPYRRPRVGQVILRSVCDRTLFVLGRAAAVAAPAGVVIWLLANITAGNASLLTHCAAALEPAGRFLGMDGAILLAFLLGFPANEIVMPILIMIYTAGGTLTELSLPGLGALLAAHGWTPVTALCAVIFALFHWPCSTTCLTVKKETGSWRWTGAAILLPTLTGGALCALIAGIARLV